MKVMKRHEGHLKDFMAVLKFSDIGNILLMYSPLGVRPRG